MRLNLKQRAFTLIELLIVVAIIAILAAIAVPNFLEAQTRAKSSRAKADMRTLATGLESYYVDYNSYPQCNDRATIVAYNNASTTTANGAKQILEHLTTPIAYLTTATFRDPFQTKFRKSAATAAAMVVLTPTAVTPATDVVASLNSYLYQATNSSQRATVATGSFEPLLVKATGWFTYSVGPDNTYYNLGGVLQTDQTKGDDAILLIYDATNGTISTGDLYRSGGDHSGSPAYAAGRGLDQAIPK
ncbi:hypothetical protein BH09SUM1_BH09SUM1_17590 [soil metagenome]